MFKNIDDYKKYLLSMYADSKTLKSNINKLLSLARLINNGLPTPFNEEEIEKICVDIIEKTPPLYCDKKGNVIAYRLAEYMIKKDPMFSDGFNIYVYKNGIYKPINEKLLYKRIYNHMLLDSNKTTAKAKEITEIIRTLTHQDESTDVSKHFINVKNGVINIAEKKLVKHSPKFRTTLQFNANYISDKEFNNKFKNSSFNYFLTSTLTKANIITLQECFGLILSPHASEVQKAFIFLGSGSNGKSATAEIITTLIGGHKNMSCLGLGDFAERFDLSAIQGKTVNLNIDDESVTLKKTGKLKSVISGDVVGLEKKGEDKITYLPNLTCIIGLNKLPSTGDKSFGFYRRQCIIPFNNTFGSKEEVSKGLATNIKNPKLIKHITETEMDIVFTWALKGLYRLINNKFILSENDEIKSELEEFRVSTDSVYSFYKFRLQKSQFESDKIKASELYAEYQKYCKELGIKHENGTNFGKELKALGLTTKRGSAGLYYIGILLSNN